MSNLEAALFPQTILMIGCGNMGSALLKGWQEAFPTAAFHIITPHPQKVASSFPGVCFYDSPEALEAHNPNLIFDIGVLAIKPKIASAVLPNYSALFKKTNLLISLLAGTTVASLNQYIEKTPPIIRAMPNLGAAAQKSATVLYAAPTLSSTQKALSTIFLNGVGATFWLEDEQQFDQAMIAVGCGPGLLYKLLACFQSALLPLGFSEKNLQEMLKTMLAGANAYAQHTDSSFDVLAHHLGKEGSYTHKGLTAAEEALQKATSAFVSATRSGN